MRRSTLRRTAAAAVAGAALVAAGASSASADTNRSGGSAKGARSMGVLLAGTARLHYAPSPQDRVHASFNTYAAYRERGQALEPGKVRGTVRVSHDFVDHEISGWALAKVDCVVASGNVALVTGDVIEYSQSFSSWKGKRIGFSVVDGGRGRTPDQVGFTGPVTDLEGCFGTAPRSSPAPFMQAQQGGFVLKHDLPPVH